MSNPMKVIIFIYVLVMPFAQPPNWCQTIYQKDESPEGGEWHWTYDCEKRGQEHMTDGKPTPIRLAGKHHLSAIVSTSIDIVLISSLTAVRFYKASYLNQSRKAKARNFIMLGILAISIINEILGLVFLKVNGNLFNLVRPIVAIVFMSQVRGSFLNVLYAFKELIFIIVGLFMYVLLFAVIAFF